MLHVSLLSMLALGLCALATAEKLPEYIVPCRRNDPALGSCATRHGQDAIARFVQGDKHFHIPSLLPLKVPQVVMNVGDSLKIQLQDAEISGFDATVLKDVSVDFPGKHLTFVLEIPKVSLISQYEIAGKILILPIEGKGPANITYTGGVFTYNMYYDLKQRSGVDYLEINNSDLKYELQGAHYQLDNLFNGNQQLSAETNKFLNENWQDVSKELSPALSEVITKIISSILSELLKKVSFDELFLP